jgi:hypothetical protein
MRVGITGETCRNRATRAAAVSKQAMASMAACPGRGNNAGRPAVDLTIKVFFSEEKAVDFA